MAFYIGRAKKQDLMDVLVQKLTTAPQGATEPYWKQVQSGTYTNEGYVLFSKGTSGKENIYIRLKVTGFSVEVSYMEGYTPDPIQGLTGVALNELAKQNIAFYIPGYTYPDSQFIDYLLSFDKDRIMLVICADKKYNASNWRKTLAWMGVPKALDLTDTKGNVVLAISQYGQTIVGAATNASSNAGRCVVLRNRRQSLFSMSWMRTITIFKSKGWNNKIFLPSIYLEDNPNNEGVRSIMHGVHPIINGSTDDFKDGDEITVGSKRYTIIKVIETTQETFSYNHFPSEWIAVEQLA